MAGGTEDQQCVRSGFSAHDHISVMFYIYFVQVNYFPAFLLGNGFPRAELDRFRPAINSVQTSFCIFKVNVLRKADKSLDNCRELSVL